MEEFHCFRCKDEFGTTRYLDIPGGNCADGVEVIAYAHHHGGDNQQWMIKETRIISLVLSPKFCLAAKKVKSGAPIMLHCMDNESHGDTIYDKWIFEDGVIKLQSNRDFFLGISGERVVLQKVNANSMITKWESILTKSSAKPATSCHLQYKRIPQHKIADTWTLENTVCVQSSADCTYFCIVGWGPGGYSGIQQIDENRKVAIFSMWNDDKHSVKEVEHGDGVVVTSFGGEGTGMKSMKDIPWENHQKVTFRVSGRKCNNGSASVWRCSCWYSIDNSDWNFMASFERSGNPPFNDHFYSFIEDWNRKFDCEGHSLRRSAEFSHPKLITKDNEVFHLKEAVFTKQRHGADEFAQDKAFGAVKNSAECFVLSTGGNTEEDILGTLLVEGCGQCTNKHLTNIFL